MPRSCCRSGPDTRAKTTDVQSREQPWPVLIHGMLVGFAGFAFAMFALSSSPLERAFAVVTMVGLLGLVVWDVVRCRSVELAEDALVVGGVRFAWADLDVPKFREVPLARAGMFVRVADEARSRYRVPPPRHHAHGVGLPPPSNPEEARKRYDLFLRARGDRLVAWHDIVMVRMLQRTAGQLRTAVDTMAKVAASPLTGFVVADDPTGITLQLIAPSLDLLRAHAGETIARLLPEDARWNPQFARGVMVFVGPLSLGKAPGADAALAHVKASVAASVAGSPRAIAAIWCQPATSRRD